MDNGGKQGKGAATIAVWIAVMVLFSDAGSSLMQALLLLSAIAATFVIWVASTAIIQDNEKAKRHADSRIDIDENEVRLRILMDMLDDEDKARIRAKLMNQFSDGEIPVDEFLEEESSRALYTESKGQRGGL